MRVLFCAHPLDPKALDPDFAAEAKAARSAGLAVSLLDFEALEAGSADKAVRRVPENEGAPEAVAYRGWMLEPERYAALFGALEAKGLRLVNDPAQYKACHWLPETYPLIAARTARTVWLPKERLATGGAGAALDALGELGAKAAIVKDYAKSQKHYWEEACFIPDAADRAGAERVVRRFLELQGDSLSGGLAFREFLDLERTGPGGRAREFRLLWLDGRLIAAGPHPDSPENASAEGAPPENEFAELVRGIPSHFLTLDAARTAAGEWIVMEAGDGQVSGLPLGVDLESFFGKLRGGQP